MDYKKPKQLFGRKNSKTIKGEKKGWITFIMYLAPHKQNSKGKNICAKASEGCAAACLYNSGFGGMYNSVQQARINKTDYFLNETQAFLQQLDKEVAKLVKKHKDDNICFRINGTSDLPFENFKIREGKNIMELYPEVQFYDYTKIASRFHKELPANYHLTFSRSESNDDEVDEVLAAGGNVAVVFDELPETYKGYKVINGDLSDLRFQDEKNVIVGLKYKNNTGKGADNNIAFETGFALRKAELIENRAAA